MHRFGPAGSSTHRQVASEGKKKSNVPSILYNLRAHPRTASSSVVQHREKLTTRGHRMQALVKDALYARAPSITMSSPARSPRPRRPAAYVAARLTSIKPTLDSTPRDVIIFMRGCDSLR